MSSDEVRGHAVNLDRGLADDFDVADNCVLHHRVLPEGVNIGQGLNVSGRALDGLGDVLKVILDALRMLHSGCACCKTSLRNFGGNASGVRTEGHAEQLFGIRLEASEGEKAGRLRGVNRQIKVALLVIGAGENRSEDACARQPVAANELPRFATVGCEGSGWLHIGNYHSTGDNDIDRRLCAAFHAKTGKVQINILW